MIVQRSLLVLGLTLSAGNAAAQIEVVGPSFAALSVPDLPASARWYREILGLNVAFEAAAPDSATKVMLLTGRGVRIELVWHKAARSLSSYAGAPTQPDMVYGPAKVGFFVSNLDQTLTALRAHGATIEGTWLTRPSHIAPGDTLWTRNILVRDNSGTYVQFFERSK